MGGEEAPAPGPAKGNWDGGVIVWDKCALHAFKPTAFLLCLAVPHQAKDVHAEIFLWSVSVA